MSMPNGQLPKSYNVGSTTSIDSGDDYGDLIGVAFVISLGHKNKIDLLTEQMKQQHQQYEHNNYSNSCLKVVVLGWIYG